MQIPEAIVGRKECSEMEVRTYNVCGEKYVHPGKNNVKSSYSDIKKTLEVLEKNSSLDVKVMDT